MESRNEVDEESYSKLVCSVPYLVYHNAIRFLVFLVLCYMESLTIVY